MARSKSDRASKKLLAQARAYLNANSSLASTVEEILTLHSFILNCATKRFSSTLLLPHLLRQGLNEDRVNTPHDVTKQVRLLLWVWGTDPQTAADISEVYKVFGVEDPPLSIFTARHAGPVYGLMFGFLGNYIVPSVENMNTGTAALCDLLTPRLFKTRLNKILNGAPSLNTLMKVVTKNLFHEKPKKVHQIYTGYVRWVQKVLKLCRKDGKEIEVKEGEENEEEIEEISDDESVDPFPGTSKLIIMMCGSFGKKILRCALNNNK